MKQSKDKKWQQIMRVHAESGKSQKDFCAAERIPFSTFRYWKHRLSVSNEKSKFVKVTSMTVPQLEITVSFEAGIRMIVSETIASDTLSLIILAVREALCVSIGTK